MEKSFGFPLAILHKRRYVIGETHTNGDAQMPITPDFSIIVDAATFLMVAGLLLPLAACILHGIIRAVCLLVIFRA